MIYVDQIFRAPVEPLTGMARRVAERNGGLWCHMWTDPGNEAELHAMASKIGLRREWFQNRKGFPHYDLTPSRRVKALLAGAVEVELDDWMRKTKFGALGLSRSLPVTSE